MRIGSRRRWRLLPFLALAGATLAAPAQGQYAGDPDWPCVQRKIPTLTPAAIWAGPPIDDADWRSAPEVADLVARLSQRRVPLEAAQAEVAAFAAALAPDERAGRLTLLFAGLFDTMNAERSEIIDGIERYARGMKTLAASIRRETAALASAQDEARASGSAQSVAALDGRQADLAMRTRIFDERRGSLGYVCDVPRIVEKRLFALGRTIAGTLD